MNNNTSTHTANMTAAALRTGNLLFAAEAAVSARVDAGMTPAEAVADFLATVNEWAGQ